MSTETDTIEDTDTLEFPAIIKIGKPRNTRAMPNGEIRRDVTVAVHVRDAAAEDPYRIIKHNRHIDITIIGESVSEYRPFVAAAELVRQVVAALSDYYGCPEEEIELF